MNETKTIELKKVGKELRKTRKEKKLSITKLGLLSGVSNSTIWRVEEESINPTIKIIEKLFTAMGYQVNVQLKPEINK